MKTLLEKEVGLNNWVSSSLGILAMTGFATITY